MDCKRLDSCIEARRKFIESLKKWMAKARAIIELQIASHSNVTVQDIASKVFELERRLDMIGIDIRSVAQARLFCSFCVNNSAESKAFEKGRLL